MAWLTFLSFLSTNKACSMETGNLTKEMGDPKPKSVTSIFVAKIIQSANKTKNFQPIFAWKLPTKWHTKRLSFGTTCREVLFTVTQMQTSTVLPAPLLKGTTGNLKVGQFRKTVTNFFKSVTFGLKLNKNRENWEYRFSALLD